MADEFVTQTPPPAPAGAHAPRRGIGRIVLVTALAAFVIGGSAVGYAAWYGLLPAPRGPVRQAVSQGAAAVAPAPPAAIRHDDTALAGVQDSLDARVAALGQRLDALDRQALAASGNAARAEALLIAFAARRAVDRGAPLGFIEDQLRLRFGDAQPNAVATVIEGARRPVTLDQLLAGLDSLAPSLTEAPASSSAWATIKREVAGLFVIRHASAPSPQPTVTLERARILLEAGKTDEAVAEVQRLPGAAQAGDWFAAARQYDGLHRALDLLETTAMLDTRGLNDGAGAKVSTPTPIAPIPAPAPAASTVAGAADF